MFSGSGNTTGLVRIMCIRACSYIRSDRSDRLKNCSFITVRPGEMVLSKTTNQINQSFHGLHCSCIITGDPRANQRSGLLAGSGKWPPSLNYHKRSHRTVGYFPVPLCFLQSKTWYSRWNCVVIVHISWDTCSYTMSATISCIYWLFSFHLFVFSITNVVNRWQR